MNCDEYQSMTSALLDGELPQNAHAALFTHLASCESCRTFFQSVQALNLSLDRIAEPLVSSRPATRAITPAMSAAPAMSASAWWHRRLSLRYPVVMAAATALLAIALLTLPRLRQAEPVYITTLAPVVVAADRNAR